MSVRLDRWWAKRTGQSTYDPVSAMSDSFYSFDVFVGDRHRGNSAGVVITHEPWPDASMQGLASELGFSETAFITIDRGNLYLRWFTPTTEVDLCGHATAATAAALVAHGEVAPNSEIAVVTRSGTLRCGSDGHHAWVALPGLSCIPVAVPAWAALAQAAWEAPGWTLLEFGDRDSLLSISSSSLAHVGIGGLIAAFVIETPTQCALRVFAPALGIVEDPVTGSAHSYIAPLLRDRIGATRYRAEQCSQRGGIVEVLHEAQGVIVSGVLALTGQGWKDRGDY